MEYSTCALHLYFVSGWAFLCSQSSHAPLLHLIACTMQRELSTTATYCPSPPAVTAARVHSPTVILNPLATPSTENCEVRDRFRCPSSSLDRHQRSGLRFAWLCPGTLPWWVGCEVQAAVVVVAVAVRTRVPSRLMMNWPPMSDGVLDADPQTHPCTCRLSR